MLYVSPLCGSHLTILMLKKVTRGHRHPIAHSYETHVHFYADDQTVYVTPILAVLFTSDQTDPSLLVTHDWSDKPEMFFIGSARHRHKTRPWTWIVATFYFSGSDGLKWVRTLQLESELEQEGLIKGAPIRSSLHWLPFHVRSERWDAADAKLRTGLPGFIPVSPH